jgi:hypothetical protein
MIGQTKSDKPEHLSNGHWPEGFQKIGNFSLSQRRFFTTLQYEDAILNQGNILELYVTMLLAVDHAVGGLDRNFVRLLLHLTCQSFTNCSPLLGFPLKGIYHSSTNIHNQRKRARWRHGRFDQTNRANTRDAIQKLFQRVFTNCSTASSTCIAFRAIETMVKVKSSGGPNNLAAATTLCYGKSELYQNIGFYPHIKEGC